MTTDVYNRTTQDIFGLDRLPVSESLPASVLADRADFLRDAILHVLDRLSLRLHIQDTNLRRIDLEQSRARTRLMQLPEIMPGISPNLDRLREQIETEVQRLETERNREEAACWKDATTLHSDLIELVREYRNLLEKLEVVAGSSLPRPALRELVGVVERGGQVAPVTTPSEPSEYEIDQLRRIP